MADIFKEVDEDVRREHYAKLWSKYGRFVIAAAVVLVLMVGGFKAWQAWDLSQRTEQSDDFAAAIGLEESEGREAAYAALEPLAEPGAGGYGLLAALEQARLLAEGGDVAAAVAIWDQVADDSAAGPAYQGMAAVLSVLHQIDDGDRDALEAKLEPLLTSQGAFRPLAMELNAALALARGDTEAARVRYGELSEDAGVPQQLRDRARLVLDALPQ